MSKARNITLPVKDSDLPLIGTCRSKTFHRGFIGFRFDFWVGFFIVFAIYPNWPWLSSIFNFFVAIDDDWPFIKIIFGDYLLSLYVQKYLKIWDPFFWMT